MPHHHNRSTSIWRNNNRQLPSKTPLRTQHHLQLAVKFGLTESAAARIAAMLTNEPDGSFFRVAVLGGGCSGFQYDFSIDSTRQADDRVFTSHGVEVVIDEMSLELVDTAELDYKQDLMGSYFAVNNPNATASCGCGTSFSV